jgi:hypothetical protein
LDGVAGGLVHQAETTQWIVVYSGFVNIRSSPSMSGEVIDKRAKCSKVVGQQEGEWIRLVDGEGYMKVSAQGESLAANISYRRTTRSCADVGLVDIASPLICRYAAEWWSTDMFFVEQSVDGNAGCYWYKGSLIWLNVPRQSREHFASTENICAAVADCQPLESTSSTATTRTTTVTFITSTPAKHPDLAGDGRSETTSSPPDVVSAGHRYPSLFCFVVAMASGYEPDMLKTHYARGYSIFSCEQYKVYVQGSERLDLGPGVDTTPLGNLEASAIGSWGSWSNTKIFIQAWQMILDAGEFMQHDWVVKVDVDTVFYPSRLKRHVISIPPDSNIWLQNCIGYPTIGALEVFSREAIATYGKRHKECEALEAGSAEDFFICKCLEQLGVEKRRDLALLRHEKPGGCENQWTVAFHPYKNVSSFERCVRER